MSEHICRAKRSQNLWLGWKPPLLRWLRTMKGNGRNCLGSIFGEYTGPKSRQNGYKSNEPIQAKSTPRRINQKVFLCAIRKTLLLRKHASQALATCCIRPRRSEGELRVEGTTLFQPTLYLGSFNKSGGFSPHFHICALRRRVREEWRRNQMYVVALGAKQVADLWIARNSLPRSLGLKEME